MIRFQLKATNPGRALARWFVLVSGVMTMTGLTLECSDSPGEPSGAAQAPWSDLVAFDSPRGIEVMRADGTQRRVLIAYASQPAWSPDGATLAFTRVESAVIYTARADGSAEQRVTGPGHSPAWSPDGTKIAFSGGANFPRIEVVNADGSNPRVLTRPYVSIYSENRDLNPTWSPDGTKLAFERATIECEPAFGGCFPSNQPNRIAVVNADGTGNIRGHEIAVGRNPAWSPDGSQIAFTSSGDIWLMHPDGSGATNLTANTGLGASDPAWSPDGAQLVFAAWDGQSDLYVINRDGTGLQRLTSTPDESEINPAWGPIPAMPGSRALPAVRRGPGR